MAKFSQLDTQSYIHDATILEDSYVLINYKNNNLVNPITSKISIDDLGKAIAWDLGLVAKDSTTNCLEYFLPTNDHFERQNMYDLSTIGENNTNITDSFTFQPGSSDYSFLEDEYKGYLVFCPYVRGKHYAPYVFDNSGIIHPLNLATPFYIADSNEYNLESGRNVFVVAGSEDTENEGKFFVMGDCGPEELTLASFDPKLYETEADASSTASLVFCITNSRGEHSLAIYDQENEDFNTIFDDIALVRSNSKGYGIYDITGNYLGQVAPSDA